MICLALVFLAEASTGVQAQSVTINFDPPAFQVGQTPVWVGDVGFLGNSRVFQPAVDTATPPYALGAPAWCENPACASGASTLQILLKKKASEVSVRVGSEITPLANFYCFPEGTDCSVYARLVGYDANGTVIVDSRDVAMFNAGSAIGLGAPITRELKISDPYGRIAGAGLFVGKGTFSHDSGNPGRVQIDQLRVDFVSGALPPPPPAPAPPTAAITKPDAPVSHPYRIQIEGTWTAPAGLLSLCVRVNEPIPAKPFCTNNATLTVDAFSVELYREALKPTGNVINVGIVDLLGRMVTVSRVLTPQPPPPPLVSIWSPSAGVWNGSALPTLSGSTWVVGAPQGFCVRITKASSPAPPPAVGACGQTALLAPGGTFTGIPLDPSQLQPGPSDVTVFVFDEWGREAHATVRGTVPANLRISGVEITQGSQTFAMNVSTGPYAGTELAQGVRTIVRVFASAASGGPFNGLNATVEGFVPDLINGGEKPAGGILLPDNGAQTISVGPSIAPLATRAKADAAFVFTLPTAWTLRSGLRLRAVVNDPRFTGTVPECTGCAQDNQVDVTQINFENPLPPMTISPVAVRWWDTAGVAQDPPAVDVVFSDLRAVLPLTESRLIVRPYAGIVDMGNSVPSATPPPNRIDNSGNCFDPCPGNVFGAVTNFEQANLPGLTIGITTAQLRGYTSPVPFPRFPLPEIENIAVASTTFNVEPLKLQVAHEVMHQSGFLHASGSCGAQSQLSEAWPPDLRGRLQGIGLDRRAENAPAPGTYAVIADQAAPNDAYDLMSYCAGAASGRSWLSPRYWSRFGKAYTASLPCLDITCQYGGVPNAEPTGYRVMAKQTADGAWAIVSVTRVVIPRSQGPQSRGSVRVVGRDDAGRLIATVSTEPVPIADEPDAQFVTVDLRADTLNSLSLVVGNRVVASRSSSQTLPRATLTYPTASGLPANVANVGLTWRVDDADGDLVTMRVDYSDDDGKTFRMIGMTDNRLGMSLPLRLFSATQTARVRLTVNDGFNETQFISPRFASPGTPPVVVITNPARDLTMFSTATMNLTGSAFDDRGVALAADRLRWSVDGEPVGTGADVLMPRLSAGRHTVELRANDRLDRPVVISRVLTVLDGGIEPVGQRGTRSVLAWWVWLVIALAALVASLLWWYRRTRTRAA